MKSLSFHSSQSQGGGGGNQRSFPNSGLFQCISVFKGGHRELQQRKNYLLLLTFSSLGVEFPFPTTKLPKFAWMLAVGEGEIEKGKETGRIKELQCKIYAHGERNNTAPQIFSSPFSPRPRHGASPQQGGAGNCLCPRPSKKEHGSTFSEVVNSLLHQASAAAARCQYRRLLITR